MKEEVCASCHLMLTQVGDNELLPVQFVRALHPCRNDRMTLRGIAANDENQISLLHIGNGTGIASIAHGAEQAHGRGRLAITGTIIDVVRANDGPRQLLHQIAFLVRTFGRRNECD